MEEIIMDDFQSQRIGIVEKIEYWKGCVLRIRFEDPKRKAIPINDTATFSIGNDCDINYQIQKRDYFQKIANSNKCLIIRNDSVMLFDCSANLDFKIKEYELPIAEPNGWELKEKFKWFKMPYSPIEKYLNNENYRKYKSEK